MLLHPDIQARAQAELDCVFGDHLPSSTSRDSTPYLNAVITEAFRWRPPVPIAVPHRLKQDDIYNGILSVKEKDKKLTMGLGLALSLILNAGRSSKTNSTSRTRRISTQIAFWLRALRHKTRAPRDPTR
ncbi:hypothetical protein FRB93_008722 [Tulasnella sp. JGI-2019a]|nr:hypothetical protein FRB93_008722 [Tulasnella sp. JGI-2019a]